jgi:tRNA threonylcarbamoyladenosine modification (KEOPS) complex Cgi121 subunit
MVPPLPAPPARTLQATGARRAAPGRPTAGEIVERLRALNAAGAEFVAVFDARAIAGERHLLSAWAHLGRARARAAARLRDRSAEFALYVAGDDQLPRALAKVGVSAESDAFVVVAERPRSLDEALAGLGMEADPSAYPRPIDATTLRRLGISEPEASAVPPSAWEGLVLERVAFVDLAPPRGAGATSRSQKP